MAIMLGNLSIKQIEDRLGIELPEEAINMLKGNRQESVNNIPLADSAWHCFDIPLIIMFGTKEYAVKFRDIMLPYTDKFKTQIQIGWER